MKELNKIMAKALAVCSFAADESAAKKSKFEPEKTLVVYFSAGGNTARAANLIAQNLGAKVVELKPVQPYTSEMRTPTLIVAGEKAHSRYFSEDAFKSLGNKNKELVIVPGAVHTDLYDNKNNKIPYDKFEEFFKANLK